MFGIGIMSLFHRHICVKFTAPYLSKSSPKLKGQTDTLLVLCLRDRLVPAIILESYTFRGDVKKKWS